MKSLPPNKPLTGLASLLAPGLRADVAFVAGEVVQSDVGRDGALLQRSRRSKRVHHLAIPAMKGLPMTSIRHWFFTSAIGLALLVPQGVSAGVILWYNGDTEVGLTANEQADSPVGALNTFDDFVVTDASGWTINTVWSNNEMDLTGIAEATWQIRSGVSIGNPGTLVAGGTAAATQSATGHPGAFPGFAEYKIEIAGLNVFLAPGTYWLSVSPVVGYDDVSNGFLHSYNGKTLGTNSINRPPTDINNGLLDGEFLSSHFSDRGADYSMGVSGHPGVAAVPEPSTLVLAVVAGASVFGRSVCRKGRR